MPRFRYRATNAVGDEISGTVTAEDSERAVQRLAAIGYQVSWLEAAGRPPGPAARGLTAPEQLAFFNNQLAAMARSGIPISQGIRALAADLRHGRLRRALTQVAADLDDGRSLGEAFAAQRHLFPPLYAHLMEAGTKSGNLPAVLLMLSNYSRAIADLRRTVVSALWYPLIVILFCVGIFTFVSFFIAPQTADVFEDFGVALPWVTVFMLFLARHIVVVLLVLAGLVIITWGGLRLLRFTKAGADTLDAWKLHTPLIGSMLRASLLSRFARTLGLLLHGGVPMLEALRLARHASGNSDFERRVEAVERLVGDGQPLGEAMRLRLNRAQVLAWAVLLGEERGDLVETLAETADIYDAETQHRARILRIALLPILVAVVTVFVAMTALTLLLPLVKFISTLGQGMYGF